MNENQEVAQPESPAETHVRSITRVLYVAIAALLVGALITYFVTTHYQNTKEAAVSNSINQAQVATKSDICQTFPDEPLCQLAQQILNEPGEVVEGVDGQDGADGKDGRGVSSFRTDSDGHLIVSYTDGNAADLGRVIGTDGVDGKPGEPGDDGTPGDPGEPGTDGISGTDGESGLDGRGISSTTVSEGSLIITYSDGTVFNAGNVVGPAGADGAKGDKGDTGDAGAPGVSVESVTVDETNTVYVTYSDGRVEPAGTVTVNPTTIQVLSCVDGVLTLTLDPYSTASTNVVCDPAEIPQNPSVIPPVGP